MMDDEVQATYGENYQRLAFCESEEAKFFGRRMAAYFSGEPYRKTFLDLPGPDQFP